MKVFGDIKKLNEAIEGAREARENAYSPYSNFRVGASIVSEITGRVYCGCNVENASFGATICAERGAILQAVSAEGTGAFSMLVVYTEVEDPVPPCALCLQVLSEFCNPDMPILLCGKGGVRREYRFRDLLPHPFSSVPSS